MPELDVTQALYAVEAAIATRRAAQDIPAPQPVFPPYGNHSWPPDYGAVLAWRTQQLARFEQKPALLRSARAYYGKMEAASCVAFITHWLDTIDPRNVGKGKPVRMPFVLFGKQVELIEFYFACMAADAPGLIDKSRDMGATWCGVGFSIWAWLFQPGIAIGWGSNHLEQVDRLGEPDTIFEKMRGMILGLPDVFRPPVLEGTHLKQAICINPDNGAVIRGQGGRSIGRGGRSRIYFVDESAHLEYPEAVEASLSENTRCRIDMSSAGSPGTVFDRTRQAGRPWTRGTPAVTNAANVFVMDWSDHPEKTQEWYAGRRKYYESKGMPQVVAREIDRNPMGAQEGVIIRPEWVEAAVDAHLELGFDDSGGWWGGLDVADSGPDVNALVRGRGSVVLHVDEWGELDPGATARRAFRLCRTTVPMLLEYDCVGMGTNVKSEFNRLVADDVGVQRWLTIVPWNAGGRVLDPAKNVIERDTNSPTNKNYFENFRAQAWWRLGQRFYRTWQMVSVGRGELDDVMPDYEPNQLISISSRIPQDVRLKLTRELSQATMGQSTRLKLVVNKAPGGAKSPNLGDGLVMGANPAPLPRANGAGTSFYAPKVFTR